MAQDGRGRPGGSGGLRSIHGGSGLDRLKRTPRDWQLTLTTHDDGRALVEIRDCGRLTSRQFVSIDDIVCADAIGQIVRQAELEHSERRRGDRR